MSFRLLIGIGLVIGFACCNDANEKTIIVDGSRAVGLISKDTIFEGLIQFYDTIDDHKMMSAHYTDGVLNGQRIDYYPNGQPAFKVPYTHGKINGIVESYDSTGFLSNSQQIYYDLRVGSSIHYVNNKIKDYYFYSLENEQLDGQRFSPVRIAYIMPESVESINIDF